MKEATSQLRHQLTRLVPIGKDHLLSGKNQVNERLNIARMSFVEGYHQALNTERERIPLLFRNSNPDQLGFMLEGAGMALTMVDELNHSDEQYLQKLFYARSEVELKFCAIGVGWASARLSKSISWRPREIDAYLVGEISNGYGFHKGFFNPHRYRSASLFTVDDEFQKDFDIGLGRALWFIHQGELEPLAAAISLIQPDRRMPIWKGVGIACVFNKTDENKSALQKSALHYETHLKYGFEIGDYLTNALISSSKSNNYG